MNFLRTLSISESSSVDDAEPKCVVEDVPVPRGLEEKATEKAVLQSTEAKETLAFSMVDSSSKTFFQSKFEDIEVVPAPRKTSRTKVNTKPSKPGTGMIGIEGCDPESTLLSGKEAESSRPNSSLESAEAESVPKPKTRLRTASTRAASARNTVTVKDERIPVPPQRRTRAAVMKAASISPTKAAKDDDDEEELARMVEAIRKKRKRTFDENYLALKLYLKQHGDCNVPYTYKEDPTLGHFVQKVRSLGRSMSLLKEVSLDTAPAMAQSNPKANKLVDLGPPPPKVVSIRKKLRRTWDESYFLLTLYWKQHGHCNVPWKYKDDPKLCAFVHKVRSDERRGVLKPEQKVRLKKLGFVYDSLDKRVERIWCEHFERLKDFHRVHQHCYVPNLADPLLASWTSKQRSLYRAGKVKSHHAEKLESIGFCWNVRDDFEKAQNNDANLQGLLNGVPYRADQSRDDSGAQSERQVAQEGMRDLPPENESRKRKQHQGEVRGCLTDGKRPRVSNSESNPMPPLKFEHTTVQSDTRSEDKPAPGARKKRKTDTLPAARTSNVPAITSTMSSRPAVYSSAGLSLEKRQMLDDIGFSWETNIEREWNAQFERLKLYKADFGHCRVDRQKDKRLCMWCDGQRERFANGNLKPHRQAKLESIGFPFRLGEYSGDRTSGNDAWLETYDKLKKFQKKYGHTNVQKTFKDKRLVSFVRRNRYRYKTGLLPKGRVKMLNDIAFSWEAPFMGAINRVERKWEQQFDQLVAFQRKHGHVDAPMSTTTGKSSFGNQTQKWTNEDFDLGDWLSQQQSMAQNGTLGQDKLEKLGKLGVSWASAGPRN